MFNGLVYLTKAMKKKLGDFIFQELVFVAEPEQFSDDDNLLEAGLDSLGNYAAHYVYRE
jgi:aryl carrier-like protein